MESLVLYGTFLQSESSFLLIFCDSVPIEEVQFLYFSGGAPNDASLDFVNSLCDLSRELNVLHNMVGYTIMRGFG